MKPQSTNLIFKKKGEFTKFLFEEKIILPIHTDQVFLWTPRQYTSNSDTILAISMHYWRILSIFRHNSQFTKKNKTKKMFEKLKNYVIQNGGAS